MVPRVALGASRALCTLTATPSIDTRTQSVWDSDSRDSLAPRTNRAPLPRKNAPITLCNRDFKPHGSTWGDHWEISGDRLGTIGSREQLICAD